MAKRQKGTSTIKHQTLFECENLVVMRGMADEIIDLIYLDPPFTDDPSQISDASSEKTEDEFKKAWSMDQVKQNWINQLRLMRPALYSIAETAGSNRSESMRAYMLYMAVRLLEMHRILKPTGSIYLHCNPYASHYLKLLMDAVFGEQNFRNEIVWHHPKIGIASKKFTSNTDTLLYYTKSANYTFTGQKYDVPNELYNRWKGKIRGNKLYYREAKTINGDAARSKIRVMSKQLGRKLKDSDVVIDFSLQENKKAVDNVWKISFLKGNSKERKYVNHPTQKPEDLLTRIIKASSKEGDWIMDPFSGSGTACIVAEEEGRNWIAIEEDPTWSKRFENRLLASAPNAKLVKLTAPPNDRKPTRSKGIEKKLYAVQQEKCTLCQVRFELRNLTVDHIEPTSKGGPDTDDNLQLLCGACNSVKNQGTQEAAIKRLKAQGVIK